MNQDCFPYAIFYSYVTRKQIPKKDRKKWDFEEKEDYEGLSHADEKELNRIQERERRKNVVEKKQTLLSTNKLILECVAVFRPLKKHRILFLLFVCKI